MKEKFSYGKPRDAHLDWQIRGVTKNIFKNPLDVIGQNIENVIDEYLSREIPPVRVNIYCSSEWLIIEDFVGMTAEDIENNYVNFGVSGKVRAWGRWGHGGKDTSLAVAGEFFILSRKDEKTCAYKIWEEESLKVRYQSVWGLDKDFPKESNGTLIIVPNKRKFTLDEIEEYVLRNFYLGLINQKIQISVGKYGGKLKKLMPTLPCGCIRKEITITFNKSDIEEFCDTPPLKESPQLNGFYLVPSKDERVLEETGWNMFCYGKYLTSILGSRRGLGYLSLDFILETNQITGAKGLKVGKRSLYSKYLLPKLTEWEENNLEQKANPQEDEEFLEEVSTLLGPLYGGKGKKTKKERKKQGKQRKKPIDYKETVKPLGGRTPGHGKIVLINDPDQPLVIGVVSDTIFYNKGNKDGEYIWSLDRKTKKILIYSRAAIFLPKIIKSKLTTEELNSLHEEALKSQEFWINAIRRDHRAKTEVIHLGDKRLVVPSK